MCSPGTWRSSDRARRSCMNSSSTAPSTSPLDVPVKQAGPYQVRACVLDSTSRAAGSAGQYLDIPDLKKQHIALTTPLIDDVSAPGETRFNDVSSALREFRAGSRLAFAFRIETDKDGRGAVSPGKFDTQIQLY